MRIVRFISGIGTFFGSDIDGARAHRIEGNLFDDLNVTDEVLSIDRLLAPVVPTDILCIGLNYKEHANEGGFHAPPVPMLFIKASNTLNDPGGLIPVPKITKEIDFEGELAIVIGKAAKQVHRDRAMDHVFGYTIANDVTARDWQRDKNLGGGQFARGKSFDKFCPLGPAIVTKDEIPEPNQLKIRTLLNGNVMQDGTTADMIFDVPALIESLSQTLTIRAGSIILTGTPPGVGFARKPPVWMKPGDSIVVEIESIGRLENRLVAE